MAKSDRGYELHKSFGTNDVLNGIKNELNRVKNCDHRAIRFREKYVLRCLNLLERPTSGEIWVDGENITDPKCNIDKVRQKNGDGIPAL